MSNPYTYIAAGILAIGAVRYYNAVIKVEAPKADPNQRNLISGDNIRLQRQGARSTREVYTSLRRGDIVGTEKMVGQFGIDKWIIKLRTGAKYVIYGPNAVSYIQDETL
jgi:hypothetical protein